MQIVSSSEARNNLAEMLDKAQHEPIAIQKQGRNAAVLLSYEEYEKLTHASITVFQALCDNIGSKAEAKGLTADKLSQILAEND